MEGRHGLMHTYYVTELNNASFTVTRDYHDTQITCTATLPDGVERSISATVKLTCRCTKGISV